MFSKALLLAAAIAYVEARFGQEQVPIAAISAVQGGEPGAAATIAGGAISTLLGAADPCDKLRTADQIITDLGDGEDSVAAAIGLVAAEQNFNNFNVDVPNICNDPTLPATEILRGITPLIDPGVTGAEDANALSEQSQATPFDATGLSVADVLIAQGFSNFNTPDGPAAGAGAGADNNNQAADAEQADGAQDVAQEDVAQQNDAAQDNAASGQDATAQEEEVVAEEDDQAGAQGNAAAGDGVTQSSIAGLDFGLCVPTMGFLGGRNGRAADEFTFLPTDPLVAQGQQEALNPAIIVNRICDQLTNVCEANQAAKDACEAAQAAVDPAQRDEQTAIDFNTALGFADADINVRRRAFFAKRDNILRKRAVEGVKRRSARV